jgi:hypothetical protein
VGLSSDGSVCDWIQVIEQPDPAPACLAAPDEVVAWWPGDGDARDMISGLASSSVAGFAHGHVGQALWFDAAHPSLSAIDTENIAPQDLSVSLWIQPGPPDVAARAIVAKPHSTAGIPSYVLELDSDNHPVFRLWNGVTQTTLTGELSLAAGAWYQLTATRQAGVSSLFVNGVLSASGSFTGDVAYSTGAGSEIELSALPDQELLDEIVIYRGALSASRINELYQAGSAGYCLP